MWELTRDFIVTDPDISIYKLVSIMRVVLPLLLLLLTAVRTYDWTNLTDTLNYYLHNGGFAGGVLRVANATHTILSRPFGTFSHNSLPRSSPPFTNDTIFDIASLTKVTATLSCIMRLVDLAKIHPDDLVTKYIPEYGNHGKEVTTLKNLLLHNAGLLPDPPASLPKNKPDIMNWIYNCALDYPVGHNFVYSDISFILLAEISERVTKKPINVYAKELFEWMGMYNSTYLPDLERELHRIAPTEYSSYRKKVVRGVVHDPTAYIFGGVAGHAGFFSVVEDIQTYMQIHLNKGVHRNGTRIYQQKTVETFFTRVDGLPYNNRRALGWDTVPIQANPPCGTLFSMNSFGHTGYTGTMMWADRDKGLIVSLMTQRVHPTAANTMIIEARARIVDQVVRAMNLA